MYELPAVGESSPPMIFLVIILLMPIITRGDDRSWPQQYRRR